MLKRWEFGPTFATIGHLAGEIHRRRCSTPRAIGAASIPRGIFRPSLGSFRPMPSGFNALFDPGRKALPATAAFCRAHGRRAFFELADIAQNARRGRSATAISPIALEAVRRIDQLFEIERKIHGSSAAERLRVRQDRSAPLLSDFEAWLRAESARLSGSSNVIKPINYLLKRWDGFARFVHDGRICLTNNAAERALRGFALGRKAWLFGRFSSRRRAGCRDGHAYHDGASRRHRPESLAC